MLRRAAIIFAIVGLAIMIVLLWPLLPFVGPRTNSTPIIIHTPQPTATLTSTATPEPLQVYVNGAVAKPDVYPLPAGGRVKQAIEAAGGFTSEANTDIINLAQPVTDGMHVYVPELAQTTAVPADIITQPAEEVRSNSIDIQGAGTININTANLQELDTLPGIGPATAQKIIDYRAANGPFASIEALLDVSGIGDAKLEQLRDLVTIGN